MIIMSWRKKVILNNSYYSVNVFNMHNNVLLSNFQNKTFNEIGKEIYLHRQLGMESSMIWIDFQLFVKEQFIE